MGDFEFYGKAFHLLARVRAADLGAFKRTKAYFHRELKVFCFTEIKNVYEKAGYVFVF